MVSWMRTAIMRLIVRVYVREPELSSAGNKGWTATDYLG
jgi:hypothetical protein